MSNQEEVKLAILHPNKKEIEAAGLTIHDLNLKLGQIYPLECSVEKKFTHPPQSLAHVTFNELINVFVFDMHGYKVYDTLKSNLLGMIEVEIENLERGEFEELSIEITRVQMTQAKYENLPEFSGY